MLLHILYSCAKMVGKASTCRIREGEGERTRERGGGMGRIGEGARANEPFGGARFLIEVGDELALKLALHVLLLGQEPLLLEHLPTRSSS